MVDEHWEKTTAEAIVADLYMNQGLGGEPQFAAPEYRRRLVVQIAGLLEERANERVKELETDRDMWKGERNQLLDMTMMLDEHPEGYDGACLCKLCQSYADFEPVTAGD
jgi:hypothetical protein